MKHIVDEFDVFTFNELSEEAKEYAIKQEQNSDFRLDWDWWESVFEDFRDEFAKIGIDDADFSFNLAYCQSDYANLAKGELNLNKIIEDVEFKHSTRQIFLDYLENYLENGKVTLEWFYDYNGSYSHLCNYLQPIAEKLEKEINEQIDELNTKLYNALRNEYSAYMDEDTIREELAEDDNKLYYKNGEFYGYI